ncbi:glycine--tRNA ligase subunit beta [Cognatishimia sp. MH4019]|uniref:glycine--tRNA ligase subunit beta n=1 Tax=Cognatishimia sp. MH4019 TaxID=2854030 RepID=UPI001CD207E6|nr:glycine--tRNA ligase subunit beta [Cognatishimia sp. MH4019]
MPDLLIELFSEEIPARMQAKAAADLQKRVTDGLVEAGITYAGARAYSTPRRLTLTLSDMLARSPDLREERKGPRADAPEKALEGFLRSTGLTKDQLELRDDKKGQTYFAVIDKPGRPAADIVAEVLEDTIRNFPWPKSMRWGSGSLRWVRPLHRILCITYDEQGTDIVPVTVDHITSGDITEGHRFMAPGAFKVTSFDDYEAKLKKAHVVLDATERADHIWADATSMAFAQGLEVVEDKGLLAEVAGLVEWPVVLMGEIGERFLDLPPEVLQSSMKEHQKFFSVRNPKTGRIEKFVTVANTETPDNGATILAGNQKVLAARLADAVFFWENDLRIAKEGMQPWLDSLGKVTFHNKLGTVADQIDRIAALSREIAPVVGADADAAEKAARLAKADLASEMVYEFPELQGIMGRYYIERAGESAEIAAVAEDHYAPLGPSDDVPTAPVSVAVALAEKIDKLTAFWAIDEKPTGSKDPFALRRAALGGIRLVLENQTSFSLRNLFDQAQDGFLDVLFTAIHKRFAVKSISDHSAIVEFFDLKGWLTETGDLTADAEENIVELASALESGATTGEEQAINILRAAATKQLGRKPNRKLDTESLLSFFHDRLKVYLRDQGIRHDVIDACIVMPGNDDLTLLVKRANALSDFLKTDDGENLLQGFKRANNILSQAEEKDGVEYSFGADIKFAETDEERALFAALDAADAQITPAMKEEDFAKAMTAMAALRAPIDAFFEAVQVNADSATIRRNRLNLLHRIRTICLSVADLTRVEG